MKIFLMFKEIPKSNCFYLSSRLNDISSKLAGYIVTLLKCQINSYCTALSNMVHHPSTIDKASIDIWKLLLQVQAIFKKQCTPSAVVFPVRLEEKRHAFPHSRNKNLPIALQNRLCQASQNRIQLIQKKFPVLHIFVTLRFCLFSERIF